MSNYNQDLLLEQQNTITKLTAENAALKRQVEGLERELQTAMSTVSALRTVESNLQGEINQLELRPTVEAYDTACAALWKHRDRAAELEQRLAAQPVAVAEVVDGKNDDGYLIPKHARLVADVPAGTKLFTAPPAQAMPDGYVLVPIFSTSEMDIAGTESGVGIEITRHDAELIWNAMLAAAPSPQELEYDH